MLCRQGTGGLETECEVWKYGPTHTSQVSSAVWKRDFSLQKGALECSVVQHTSAVPSLGLSCPQWTVRAPLREVLSGQEFSVLTGHWGQMLTQGGHCPAICYRGLAPIRKCPGPLGGSTHPTQWGSGRSELRASMTAPSGAVLERTIFPLDRAVWCCPGHPIPCQATQG